MANIVYATDDENTFLTRFKLTLRKVGLPTSGFKDFPDSDSFLVEFAKDKENGGGLPIVFLDINLKGSKLDGFGILRELRERLNGHPVIAIVSTSARAEEIERARQMKANCYIVKSGSLSVFSERMAAFKRDFVDTRIDEFVIYGEEEVI